MRLAAHRVLRFAGGGIALLACANLADAHGFGQRYDLPLPLSFYLLGAALAVGLSFAIVALPGRRPATRRGKLDRAIAIGTLPRSAVVAMQVIAAAALALVLSAGLLGHQSPFKNIAPVAIWVLWWVGLGLASAFVGNVWPIINPWTALFAWAEAGWGRVTGRRLPLRLQYPERLGAWPACLLFLAFAWLELLAPDRDQPRVLALAAALYSLITLAGFAVFGRKAWLRNGEAFSLAFGLLGRFAPLRFDRRCQRWQVALRPPAFGLRAAAPLSPSLTAFAVLMLATVTVDGLLETPLWASFATALLADGTGAIASGSYRLLGSALLIAGPVALGALFVLAAATMRETVIGAGRRAPTLAALCGWFVPSLVPIAIAYHLAHYISLLLIAGQFAIPLASDPFGFGWDLFGTTLYRVDISVIDARTMWYVAVIAVVIGHIIALWLAHDTAQRLFEDERLATRGQYPMVVLMIGYTALSLWILAQPITEAGG